MRSRPGFASEVARFDSWQHGHALGSEEFARMERECVAREANEEPFGVKGTFAAGGDDAASRRSSNGAAPGGLGRRLRSAAPDPHDPRRQALLQDMLRAATVRPASSERPATAASSAQNSGPATNVAGACGARRRVSFDTRMQDSPEVASDLMTQDGLTECVSRKAAFPDRLASEHRRPFGTSADLAPEMAQAPVATLGGDLESWVCPGAQGTSFGGPTTRQQLPCRRWNACAPFGQEDRCDVVAGSTQNVPSTVVPGRAGEPLEVAGRPPPVRSWRTRRR